MKLLAVALWCAASTGAETASIAFCGAADIDGAIEFTDKYIQAGNPGNDGEQRLVLLRDIAATRLAAVGAQLRANAATLAREQREHEALAAARVRVVQERDAAVARELEVATRDREAAAARKREAKAARKREAAAARERDPKKATARILERIGLSGRVGRCLKIIGNGQTNPARAHRRRPL